MSMTDFESICKMLDSSEDCTSYEVVHSDEVFSGEIIGVLKVCVKGVEFVFHGGLEELLTVRGASNTKMRYTGRGMR